MMNKMGTQHDDNDADTESCWWFFSIYPPTNQPNRPTKNQ